jgi:hypothetical protein
MTFPSYTQAWSEILDASGLEDLASEKHGHDLLDGVEKGKHGAPLDYVFRRLCSRYGVKSWRDVEDVLVLMRTVDGFEHLRVPDIHLEDLAELEICGPKVGICDHTSVTRGTYSNEWITPSWVLEISALLYGSIHVDLASSKEANWHVTAQSYWSADNPCPTKPNVPAGHVIWCNPPGPCVLVKKFWQAWQYCIADGAYGSFLIFKQDHWRQIPAPSMDVTALVLRRRIRFVGAKGGANFPSTLILSGDQLDKPWLYDYGHLMLWKGRQQC